MTDNNNCQPYGYIKIQFYIMNKNDIINKIYFEKSGYGSMQNTLKDAKQVDKTIKLEDVKTWFTANVEQQTKYSKKNSYVAQKPYEEYQVDLFFY